MLFIIVQIATCMQVYANIKGVIEVQSQHTIHSYIHMYVDINVTFV